MTIMVFRAPGPHKIHGHQVEYKVLSEDDAKEHMDNGWFYTAVEAGEALLKEQQAKAEAEVQTLEDTAAATRDEIEQKLEQLGVTFDRRLGNTKLLALIDKTLKEREQANS